MKSDRVVFNWGILVAILINLSIWALLIAGAIALARWLTT